jgi:dTDP-4-dehydrorhamnose reductase
VLELIARGHGGVYHVVNEGVCSYETFAREAARLAGVGDDRIDLATEASMARPARRPRWTAMRCLLSERLGLPPLRSWQDALTEYV